jgi:hypothetical protein
LPLGETVDQLAAPTLLASILQRGHHGQAIQPGRGSRRVSQLMAFGNRGSCNVLHDVISSRGLANTCENYGAKPTPVFSERCRPIDAASCWHGVASRWLATPLVGIAGHISEIDAFEPWFLRKKVAKLQNIKSGQLSVICYGYFRPTWLDSSLP